MPTFLEFFCGGGMVRAGLGADWKCLFANDYDHKKCKTYALNWGGRELLCADVRNIDPAALSQGSDLAWASFPCQDLSLAGGGAGLKGDRSGTFRPFWSVITSLSEQGRAPTIVALENVCGTLTSHQGEDFSTICSAFRTAGYRVGALVVDAIHFLPQSRPRLFIIGTRKDVRVPATLISEQATGLWHSRSLVRSHALLSAQDQANWIWWALPAAATRRRPLREILERAQPDIEWHGSAQTQEYIHMMNDLNRDKLEKAQSVGTEVFGTMYRRTRPNRRGGTVQRIEVRFDGIAGCLRTPAGGSSRQLVIRVKGADVKTRLMTAREAASLMGLPKSYELPSNYNEAYHLAGDGVAVPVVRHIAQNLFLPILQANPKERKLAA